MFYNLKKRINTNIFNYFVRDIVNTPKVICDDNSGFVLLSQLCSRDLYMYLAALKSFTAYLKPYQVVIVGDRLTDKDEEILVGQIPNLKIIKASEVNTTDFPQGGTWERLLTIIDASQHHFVIQLDADTLTLADLFEIKECVIQNRSFTLGTALGQKVITFQEASDLMVANKLSEHIQVQAELALGQVDLTGELRYVRGCSGFAGFAKGSCNRQQLKEITGAIEKIIGKSKWYEWGSEQVASNILIANSNSPTVLPIAKYNYFKPGIDISKYSFLHFIGEYRFCAGTYWKLASSLLIK